MPDETEEFDFADYEVEVEEEIETEDDVESDESEIDDDESTEEESETSEVSEEPVSSSPTKFDVSNLEMEPLSQEAMNLTISLEVGRINFTLEKLLELQEGNILELDAQLDQPIDLVVGDRCVGRGELVKVGDSLGVRILEMA